MKDKSKGRKVSSTVMIEQKSYLGLTLSIAAFLLIVMGIFALNNYTAQETAQDSEAVNLSTHMRDSIQSITRDLFDMKLSDGDAPYHPHIRGTIDEIRKNSTFLTAALNAFEHGGTVSIPGREAITIEAATEPNIREVLEKAGQEWRELLPTVQAYTEQATKLNRSRDALETATITAQTAGLLLYDDMDTLSDLIHEQTRGRAKILKTAQLTGIGIAVCYFLIFIFFFVRRLRKTDIEIAAARKETTEIMETIQEGLFLIDADLRIGMQQSSELSDILPVSDIAGRQLDDVIGGLVSETDLSNTRRFVKQLFNKRVKEKLLDDLNPLRQVKLLTGGADGRPVARFLRFKFNRVYEEKKIVRVLVTVSNITESVLLQRQLEAERRQNQAQTEMLLKVLHLDQSVLSDFVRRTTQITQRVNNILKTDGNSQKQLRQKLDDIAREVHSFKGEASALAFDNFVTIAEDAENKLQSLRRQPSLSGNDFIGLTVILEHLISLNEDIKQIQEKLAIFGQKSSNHNPEAADIAAEAPWKRRLRDFAAQIAGRQNKQVHVSLHGIDALMALPESVRDPLSEIMTQLLRNAIVHGIEQPDAREQSGKPRVGNISFGFKEGDGYSELSVQDDGAGIDFAALREKLRQDPRYQSQDIDALDEKSLCRALFLPGLSTADSSDEDAGRGDGMGIVRDRIKQLKDGKIAINSVAGHSTRFAIRFQS